MIEAMVAMGLVAIIALSSLTFYREVSKSSHRSREICRLYNNSTLDRIRSYGAVGAVANYAPLVGETAKESNIDLSAPFTFPTELDTNTRWPNKSILLPNSGGTVVPSEINNAQLIQGYMTILQTLYNQHANICSNWVPVPVPGAFSNGNLFIPRPKDLEFSTSATNGGPRMMIVPYNIDTGEEMACSDLPRPARISPRGSYVKEDPTKLPFGTAEPLVKLDSKLNVGFIVKLKTGFLNDSRLEDTCNAEERFQYSLDTSAPPPPNIIQGQMIKPPGAFDCIDASRNDYLLTIGYSTAGGNKIEAGSVLLCQDLSVMPVDTDPLSPSSAERIECRETKTSGEYVGPGKQISVDNQASGYYPPASGPQPWFTYQGGILTGLRKWRPCSEVTVCNVEPSGNATYSKVSRDVTDSKVIYTMHYENLPSDCRIAIKVIAVDTAANYSGLTSSGSPTTYDPTTDSALSSSTNTFQENWDVPRPRCGVYCPRNAWPDGYFVCSGGC